MPPDLNKKIKLLAISSGGGHWVQLLRIRKAFRNCDVTYVTVSNSYASDVSDGKFYTINDATRWNRIGLIEVAIRVGMIIRKERPDVVISTGAAPGYIALRIGRLTGARGIWLDSIANVEELSLSGRKIAKYADLWLTQWPHLAKPEGPHFLGSVL